MGGLARTVGKLGEEEKARQEKGVKTMGVAIQGDSTIWGRSGEEGRGASERVRSSTSASCFSCSRSHLG